MENIERECIFCRTLLDETDECRYACNDCYKKVKLLKDVVKLDKAQENIETDTRIYLRKNYSYQKERDSVLRKILEDDFKFLSADEMCFALQLEKENIRYFPNYKIGSCKVDFFLPDMRRIIEIDGELYHKNENKDFMRERYIMSCVGEKYEIVRIPASYVPRYIIKNLKEVIQFVVEKRNFDGRFRDTRYDKLYFEQYLDLQYHLRRSKGGSKRISKSN